jgi:hypothetical protein
MDKSEIAKQLGSLGGKATSKKYGKKFYQEIAERTNAKKKAKKLLLETTA